LTLIQPEKIRNVAVVGHGGSGKTTLVESLLHAVGATTRLGKVDDSTSILDTDPEEQKRRITINIALASFTHDGTKINLLDTPGFLDFAGDQHAALRVAADDSVAIDRAPAAGWLERRLAEPRAGVATVVFQSLVLQYLDDEQRTRVRAAIEAAAATATARAPLAWLRMEPGGELAEVRLRVWPGGEDTLVALAGYHGRPVRWLGG